MLASIYSTASAWASSTATSNRPICSCLAKRSRSPTSASRRPPGRRSKSISGPGPGATPLRKCSRDGSRIGPIKIARALDFLNARQHLLDGQRVGIQHGNIKPTNLLLFGETVKISDFGLATPTGTPVKVHQRAGTWGYAAPEVLQGRLSDWTDQDRTGA